VQARALDLEVVAGLESAVHAIRRYRVTGDWATSLAPLVPPHLFHGDMGIQQLS